MVKCPSCGAEVDTTANFCPRCGGSLTARGPVASQATSQVTYRIKYQPSYSLLEVDLPSNESITAESGSMTYMSPSIEIKTRTRMSESGIWGTIKVSLLGGETLFINDFTAMGSPGKIGFVSAPLGDITCLEVGPNKGYIIQSAAYIASTRDVQLDTQWQGFTKGLFGQNLFMIRTLGVGQVFINTFGAIDKHDLSPGETLVVDNFHLAAMSASCQYKVRMFGGLKSTVLGGEGLVTEVTGPGEVYIQTKNPEEFVNWLWRYIAPRVHAEARAGRR